MKKRNYILFQAFLIIINIFAQASSKHSSKLDECGAFVTPKITIHFVLPYNFLENYSSYYKQLKIHALLEKLKALEGEPEFNQGNPSNVSSPKSEDYISNKDVKIKLLYEEMDRRKAEGGRDADEIKLFEEEKQKVSQTNPAIPETVDSSNESFFSTIKSGFVNFLKAITSCFGIF